MRGGEQKNTGDDDDDFNKLRVDFVANSGARVTFRKEWFCLVPRDARLVRQTCREFSALLFYFATGSAIITPLYNDKLREFCDA